jgi:(p)ppGpp synthase/HD superfamily hydrolase
MVDMLTRDRPDGSKLSVQDVLNKAYQLKDKEVLIIKLFDRLHNIRTLDYMSEVKIERTLSETIHQFIIPAVYYGYYEIEKELWKIYCHYKSLNYMSLAFLDEQFNNKPLVALSQAYKNVEFPK